MHKIRILKSGWNFLNLGSSALHVSKTKFINVKFTAKFLLRLEVNLYVRRVSNFIFVHICIKSEFYSSNNKNFLRVCFYVRLHDLILHYTLKYCKKSTIYEKQT